MRPRVHFLMFALLLLAGATARSQGLGQYPTWANPPQLPPFSPADPLNPPGSSTAWASVPDTFKTGYIWGTPMVMTGSWSFSSHSSSGDIAVDSGAVQLGGIQTGFSDILFLAMTKAQPASKFPGKDAVLMWSGKKSNGKWGVGLIPLKHGAQINTADMLTIQPESNPGEVWLSCGIVDGLLYVLDAAGSKVLRFSSSAQGVFDVRETNFSVTIPEEDRVAIYGFLPVTSSPPSPKICELLHHKRRVERFYITQSGSPPQFAFSTELPTNLELTRVGWRGITPAGLQKVVLQGPCAHVVRIEHSTSAVGPWLKMSSDYLTPAEPQPLVVDLTAPLQEGEFIRIFDATTGVGNHVRAVPPAKPTILAVWPLSLGAAQAKGEVTIYGGNWGANPTVTFKETKLSAGGGSGQIITHAVTILQSGPDAIRVRLPDIDAKGFLEVTFGISFARYWLGVSKDE